MSIDWNDLSSIDRAFEEASRLEKDEVKPENIERVSNLVHEILKEAPSHLTSLKETEDFYSKLKVNAENSLVKMSRVVGEKLGPTIEKIYSNPDLTDSDIEKQLLEFPEYKTTFVIPKLIRNLEEEMFYSKRNVTEHLDALIKIEQEKKEIELEKERFEKEFPEKKIELIQKRTNPLESLKVHSFKVLPFIANLPFLATILLDGTRRSISIFSILEDLIEFKKENQKAFSEVDNKLIDQCIYQLENSNALEMDALSLSAASFDLKVPKILPQIMSKIQSLEIGEHFIIPGGNDSLSGGGHAVIYKISKVSAENLMFEIYNTGLGSFQDDLSMSSPVYASRYTAPNSVIANTDFIESILEAFIDQKSPSYPVVAEKIENYFKENEISKEKGPQAPHQMRGSCTFESVTAYLRSVLPPPLFSAFELFYTEKTIPGFEEAFTKVKDLRDQITIITECVKSALKTVEKRKISLKARSIEWLKDSADQERYGNLFASILKL